MADYQQVVEEIRFFLQGSDQTLRDEIRNHAISYAEFAKEANGRLRRCKEFLVQNLRSEAIQVAEAAPNLVDMVAVLSFPELPEWEEFCTDHALAPPPKLLLLVAEDLNKAYAAEQPLKEHLKKLRHLALVRAPLDQRLQVMRDLATLDPQSHYWEEDIIVFEAARHRELEEDVRQAAQRQDTARLKSLAQELQSEKWRKPPPVDLINKVKKALSAATRSTGRERINALLPQLLEAAHAGDIDRARRLRSEWEQATREARLGPDDEAFRQAVPALDWIAEHDRHAAAEAAFHRAASELITELNRGRKASIPQLERKRQEALALGRPLPVEVEERYASTIAGIQAAAAWNRRLFLLGTAGAVLVVVGLIGFFVMTSLRGREVQNAVAAIQQKLDAGDIEGAELARNQLRESNPAALESPAMQPLLERLGQLQKADEARAAEFAQHFKAARQFVDRDVLDRAQEELTAAEKVARLTSERQQLADLKLEIELAQTDASRENDKRVDQAVTQADAKLPAIDRAIDRQDFSEAASVLKEVRDLVNNVSDVRRGVAEATLQKLEDVRGEIQKRADRLDSIQAAAALEGEILRAVDRAVASPSAESLTRLQELLTQYVQQFPEGRRAEDFRTAANDVSIVTGATLWSLAQRSWGEGEGLVRLSSTEAGNRRKQCEALLADHAGLPDAAAIRAYAAYAASVTAQNTTLTKIKSELITRQKLMTQAWLIEIGGQRWYSSSERTADGNDTLAAKIEAGADSLQFSGYFRRDGSTRQIQQSTRGKVTSIREAPQVVLGKQISEMLTDIETGTADWELAIVEILQRIYADEETDPVQRLALLDGVMNHASLASTTLAKALLPQTQAIDRAGIDLNASWMDPSSVSGNEARDKARKFLADAFPSLATVPDRLEQAREEVRKPLLTRYDLAGVLWKNEAGEWTCRISPQALAVANGRQLAVISTPAGSSAGTWRTIGSVSSAGAQLSDQTSGFLEGRLVFSVRKAGTNP